MDTDLIIRLGAFVFLFTVFAIWEMAKPKRRRTMKKSIRWFSNLTLVTMNTLLMPVLAPIAADVERDSSLERFMEGTVTDKQAIAMMADRVTTVVARARGSMDKLGEVDLASQDLVIEIVRGLEKHLWMLRVQLT